MIEYRIMEQAEASEVKKLAKKSFGWLMALLVPTPKISIVAVDDNKIVGATILEFIVTKDVKIGDLNIAFVIPEYQGKGIGKKLYEKSIEYMWEQGCTAVSSNARDDNVGSWQLFLDNGMNKCSIFEGIRQLGLKVMFLQYFKTSLPYSNGYEFYLKLQDRKIQEKKNSSSKYITLFILLNLCIISFALLTNKANLGIFFLSYISIMFVQIFCGFIGTKLSKNKWSFRTNSGGIVLSLLISILGGIYPVAGNWYPKKYEKTTQFKRDMGIVSLFEWIAMLIIVIGSLFFIDKSIYFTYTSYLGAIILLYKGIGFSPLEPFGGERIRKWNKPLFIATLLISLVLFISVFFIL